MSDSNSSPPGTTVVPSVTQPLVDPKSGQITQTWVTFFYSLYQRTGGAKPQTAGSMASGQTTLSSQVATLAKQVAALTSEVAGLVIPTGLVEFFNSGVSAGKAAKLNTNGRLNFALQSGVMNLTLPDASTQSISPQVLGGSPFNFVASTDGALSISGGFVQTVMLTRGSTSIQLYP